MPEPSHLRVVGRRIELDAALAQALAGRGVRTLAVDADQVRVSGAFVLPGAAVQIRCRELVGTDAVLDVSGVTPAPDWSEPRAPNGAPKSVDGQPGQDGVPGMSGGVIGIACQRLVSVPQLLACGSPGGDSQGGGDGLKPATPAAGDGAFNKDKDGGRFGGRVLKKFGWSYFLSVAYGEHGRDGAKGGDGGAPGRPGPGGAGGTIDVSFGEASPPPRDARADPGAPGACGAGGKGAAGGDAGLGGLHRLYRYEWFKRTLERPMDSGNAEVVSARKTYKLAPRAASGKAGAPGRDSDVRYEAQAGAPGEVRWQSVTPGDPASRFDAGFLRQLNGWAERAFECGEPESAEAIARWGLSLVDAGAAPADATALRRSLEQLLSRLRPLQAEGALVRS